MRAVVLEQFGTPLVTRNVTKPTPGPGEVLIRVVASGVNPLDTKIQAGKAAHAQTQLPAVLGLDVAGVIEAIGADPVAAATAAVGASAHAGGVEADATSTARGGPGTGAMDAGAGSAAPGGVGTAHAGAVDADATSTAPGGASAAHADPVAAATAAVGVGTAGEGAAVGSEGVGSAGAGSAGNAGAGSGSAGAGFVVGDGVFGLVGGVGAEQGTLAEYVAVDARLLARKPAALSFREAAVLPLVFITAWEALVDQAKVQPGQTVLIHGGAGGIGQVAIQLAKARGAEVFATGSPKSLQTIAELGATAIDYTSTTVEEYVDKHTAGEGFDVVFDTVGGETLDNSFKAAKRYRGHVVSALGWGTHSLAPLSFRSGTYSGVFTLHPLLTGEDRAHHGEILREAAALADQGALRPRLHDQAFTLDTVTEAHALVEEGKATGKVVVDL